VREAARSAPVTRTALGGRVRGDRPVVTLTVIGVCVVSYLLQRADPGWTSRWAFAPFAGEVEPWRFLTAAFLHSPGSLLHILFNMYALWLVGPYLEQALGRWRFVALYLLTAVGGQVGVTLLASPEQGGGWFTAVVGASGAVFGLFGAVLVVLRRLGRDARQILVFLALNAVIGFVVPGIAWQAHLGGLLTGLALGAAYAYAPRHRRPAWGVAATALLALALVVLAVGRYAAV
jgi:membrane associated rhomboid family serine protease